MSNHVSSRQRKWFFEIWPHIVTWLNKNNIILVKYFYICKSPFSIHIHLLFHWAALISIQSIFTYSNTCHQPPQWKIAGIRVFIWSSTVEWICTVVKWFFSCQSFTWSLICSDWYSKQRNETKKTNMHDIIVNQKKTFALSF